MIRLVGRDGKKTRSAKKNPPRRVGGAGRGLPPRLVNRKKIEHCLFNFGHCLFSLFGLDIAVIILSIICFGLQNFELYLTTNIDEFASISHYYLKSLPSLESL